MLKSYYKLKVANIGFLKGWEIVYEHPEIAVMDDFYSI